MKYEVLHAEDLHELTRKVNEHIAAGWKPQGGIATVRYRGMPMLVRGWNSWYQAMVLDND